MIPFVADTHAIVWHLVEPRRLGKAARRAFSAADSGRWLCHVPVIALVEISLLHERGRIRVGPAQILEALSGHTGYSVLPLDLAQALAFDGFPSVKDPMDRLVLSAALALSCRVVSSDQALDDHGVDRVWD